MERLSLLLLMLFATTVSAKEVCLQYERTYGGNYDIRGGGVTLRDSSMAPWELGLMWLSEDRQAGHDNEHPYLSVSKMWHVRRFEVGAGVGYFIPPYRQPEGMGSRANFKLTIGMRLGSDKHYARVAARHKSNGELQNANRSFDTVTASGCRRFT